MRTLIVSDLHLGSLSRTDLLRREEMRAPLLELACTADRMVLLGDVLELRHGPMREALASARPVLEDLGRAMAGRELVIVPGNHDHALVEPWLAHRGEEQEPTPLGLEQLLEPASASPALERIAQWAAPARVRGAYPGLWLRADVYATHGHYLDCHLTVPTLERLSLGAMCRLLGRPASTFSTPGDYEAIVAPVFAWRDAVARDARTGAALNGMATVAAWGALGAGRSHEGRRSSARNGDPRRAPLARRVRARALAAGFRLAVAVLNRAGLGPLRAELSLEELRRAGLEAMGEVAGRLKLGESYVVFGHTHRAGPLPSDPPAQWRARSGAMLVNAGSWNYSSIFLTDTPGESPYWPGTCVLVEDDGPPQLLGLLEDRARAELAAGLTTRRSASPAR